MRTLTLKIEDDYFIEDKIIAMLKTLPEKALQIEEETAEDKLASLQNEIKSAMDDVKTGRTKVVRVID